MNLDHLLFCANHHEKIAKRHCKKCNQDICNECVFDLHIEHHKEITKINYKTDNRSEEFTNKISEEIKEIINKSLESLKPQICQIVLDKTKEYINIHKNLQLKSGIPMNANEKLPNNVLVSEKEKQNDSNEINNAKKENEKNTVVLNQKNKSEVHVIKEQKKNENKNNIVPKAKAVSSFDKLEDANPLKNGPRERGVKDLVKVFGN